MTFATEDIVDRLRAHDEYSDPASPAFCGKVADEIERLRAERDDLQVLLRGRTTEFLTEIQRLRAAGDALEVALSNQPYTGILVRDVLAALAAWREARRG